MPWKHAESRAVKESELSNTKNMWLTYLNILIGSYVIQASIMGENNPCITGGYLTETTVDTFLFQCSALAENTDTELDAKFPPEVLNTPWPAGWSNSWQQGQSITRQGNHGSINEGLQPTASPLLLQCNPTNWIELRDMEQIPRQRSYRI